MHGQRCSSRRLQRLLRGQRGLRGADFFLAGHVSWAEGMSAQQRLLAEPRWSAGHMPSDALSWSRGVRRIVHVRASGVSDVIAVVCLMLLANQSTFKKC